MSRPRAPLLIDASEWFVDEVWRAHVASRHWRRLPQRAERSLLLALQMLRRHECRATFCVPAAVARRTPALIEELVAGGHEVALSVATERPLDEIDAAERDTVVAAWVRDRIDLERVLGAGVHGFRAAWSAADGEAWWRHRLLELAFDYDATGVRGADEVAVRLASTGANDSCRLRVFHTWRLDDQQPRLRGLPNRIRATHEERVRTGSQRLCALLAEGGDAPTVAQALKCAPKSVGLGPPPPPPPTRKIAVDAVRLAIVVPLKDEADGIAALFAELDVLTAALADVADCEFVLVDDGSSDRTWPQLEQLARSRPRVRLVRHEVNRGVAAAIRTGMLATDAELVASIDGDLSYDPMELRAMLARIGDADVVTASPYHSQGAVRNVPAWRLFLSRSLSLAYRVLLRSRIRTWTSCFRLYRRGAVVDLPLRFGGFLGTAELLVRVLRRGGRVAEHPAVLEARLLGFSKMRVFETVLDHLGLLLLVALRVIR